MLERYSPPTQFDEAPYGTVWKSLKEDVPEMYVQLSIDKEQPDWDRMGLFLERMYRINVIDAQFIESVLKKSLIYK